MIANPSVVIQSDVPLPENPWRPSGSVFRALARMQVGESFAVPYRKRAASNLHTQAGRVFVRVATRTVVEDGERRVRVWRIA